jgi:hypothetical protein
VGLDLLSTYVLTFVLLTIFQRRIPISFPKTSSRSLSYTQTVPVYPGPPQKASMVWYSDEALEAFAIVVWSLAFVLFLVALALPCPLRRRDVKDWSTCCNKCVTSLLGLVFVSHIVTSDEGTLHFAINATKKLYFSIYLTNLITIYASWNRVFFLRKRTCFVAYMLESKIWPIVIHMVTWLKYVLAFLIGLPSIPHKNRILKFTWHT